jgi:hypothetical protein
VGHNHFSASAGPVHQTEDQAAEQASPSREKRTHKLLMSEEMGDRKPSQFLRHLRNLDS